LAIGSLFASISCLKNNTLLR